METNIKKNTIKAYNFQQYLTKGTYLDVRDSSSRDQDAPWRLAKIIEREDKYLTVRFDAWQSKYDEQIHVLSNKIAPLRKYTEGYTGPQRKTIRDSNLRFDNLDEHKSKMEKMASLQQQSFSPHEINQYLRAEIFIQIDSFLTFMGQLTTQQVKNIVNYIEFVIQFVIKFCQKCLSLAGEAFEQYLNIKDAYLLNEKWAYLGALQQVLYYLILILLIKGENRNKLYTLAHKKLDWSAIYPVQQYTSIVEFFKSLFIKKNGLETIKKIFSFKQITGRGFYSTIRKSCLLIANICNYKLPFPILEPKDYIQTYKLIPIFLQFYPKQETQIAILEYSIHLGIGNNSFESKLKGINQFKNNLQKIKLRSNNNLFKIVTEEKLLDILKSNNFLETMIDGKNFNSQIFKRSMPIIKFIGEKKGLQTKQIQAIFKLAENRHESQTILIYGVIAELASFGSVDVLDFIYSEIMKLKLNQFTINLMKQFTVKAIENLSKQNSFFGLIRRKKNSSKYDYYGLNTLWKEIQDDGKLQIKYFGITMDALKYIFSSESFKSVRQTYLIDCLQNIKKKKNFGQAIRLFLNILLCYNVSSILGENRGDVVQKLDKKYQIIQISTNGLKKYQYLKISYSQSLQYFFQFLEEYNGNLRVSLKIENIKNLWKLDNNINSLLNFLRKTKISEEKQIKKKYIKRISTDLIKQLFQNIFLQLSMMNNFQIPLNVYDTVDQLFITFNMNVKNLEINDRQTIRLLNVPLTGTQFYQRVLFNPNNKSNLLNKAKKRYVQLHIRLKDYTDIQKKLGIWVKFFDRLINILTKQPAKKDCVIPILHQFLRQIQGKMVRQNVTHSSIVQIVVKVEDHIKSIKLPRNNTIFKLRKLIMSQFNIQNDFVMETVQSNKDINFIEEEDYSVNAIQLANKGPSIRVYLKKTKHPHMVVLELFKQKISYKSDIFETLINLMSQNSNNQQIWDILDLLPKNRSLLDKLQFLDDHDNAKWKQFFNQKNYKKLNYKLRLLSDLIRKQAWVKNFKKTGGFIQLINRTINIPANDFKVLENIKPISYLCKMIFIGFQNHLQGDQHINKQEICKKLIEYMKLAFDLQSVGLFINNSIKLFLKLLQYEGKHISLFFADYQFIKNLVIVGVLKFSSKSTNQFIMTFIQMFSTYTPSQHKIQVTTKLIQSLLNYQRLSKFKDCEYYFNLLLKCLEQLNEEDYTKLISKEEIKIEQTINKFTEQIFWSAQKQANQKDFNSLIYGALRLKSFLLKKNSPQNQSLEKLIILLIGEYLFHQNQLSTSRIKSIKNIHQLYHLLSIVFRMDESFVKNLTQIIVPKLQNGEWRKLSYMDWMIQTDHEERKLYCGLKNLRAICYINCLLQQFFMIEPFRQAILEIDSQYYNKDLKQNEIFQFQKLFTFLKISNKGSYNPREFCEALKVDVGVQSDVDEFFNSFMQKLQNFLKVQGKVQIVDNCFKGTLLNQLICEGKHQIQREEGFLSLGVTIKNKNSLQEALKSYIEGQILDGQNAYYCQKCEKKVRTLKRVCVRDLPNVLIIVLKRFQFNYDTMKKIKINDYCSFPIDIDLKKITNQYLKEKDEDKIFMEQDYYKFKLRGVVVHYGSSQAGHYYSYIKKDKDWFEFNDENISSFNINEIAQQTFGGTEAFGNQDMQSIKTQKCKNAYLLFYERSSFYNKNRQKTTSMLDITPKETKQKYNRLNQLAIRDNSNFEFVNIIFQPEFAKFIINLSMNTTSIETIKLAFIYFHTVVLRNRQKEDYLIILGQKLEYFLKNQIKIAQWYINQINRNFIRQFTLDAPKLLKYVVVGFIKIAMSTLPMIPSNFIKILVSCLQRKGMTPFAKLFYDISKRPEGKQQLQKLFYPQRTLAYLISDSPIKCEDIIIENQPISEFGMLKQKKQKQREFDSIGLTQSLQNFKISYEDLETILLKTNCKSSRKSIARMAMHHMNTIQQIQKKLASISQKIIQGDQKDIKNYMYWFRQLLNQTNVETAPKVQLIVKYHLMLFEPYEKTYYPFETLLKYLFKFAFKYPEYKTQLLAQFDQNPKSYKTIQNWIDLSGSATKKVYNQQWTVFKKKLAGSLPETSSYYQDKRQFRIKLLQKIMTKNTTQNATQISNDIIDSDQQIINRDLQLKKQDIFIKIGLKNISKVSIMKRVGLLYQVSVEGNIRWYIGDKDQMDFYNSII